MNRNFIVTIGLIFLFTAIAAFALTQQPNSSSEQSSANSNSSISSTNFQSSLETSNPKSRSEKEDNVNILEKVERMQNPVIEVDNTQGADG